MAKLFDQQQLSAGVQEFEEHLRRVHGRDWTADCQLAKPVNDSPAPARREGIRKAAARNARGAAPAKAEARPAGLAMETLQSRRLILALAALVLVTFAGAMSLALTDGGAPSAQEDVSAIESDARSTIEPDAPSAAPPTSEATQPQIHADVSAPAAATSETYVSTIRPDGSLAPDTTPHATVAPRAIATPAAAAPAPTPDAIASIITSGAQSESAPSAPVEASAPSENPPAAKPAKKRTAAHADKLASANPAAADGDPAATVADPAHPAAAAKPVAAKPVVPKPAASKPVAAKPRAASVAADNKTDGAPDSDDGGGIFEGARQAVGSLTGAVRKLVGAE